jgi:hypothetical protein
VQADEAGGDAAVVLEGGSHACCTRASADGHDLL